MAWTYDEANLEKDRNWIRFRLGDLDTNKQQVTDEAIDTALAETEDKYEAAAICAEAIGMKYARFDDDNARAIVLSFNGLADRLRAEKGAGYL